MASSSSSSFDSSSSSSRSISSESSSSSLSSSSSSSSLSSLSSSSSSSSISSSSSSSFSSSSSSIDSSSSSSIDSSSSSSSFEHWNRSKSLILGMSAVTSSTIENRLAQTVTITSDTFEISKVFIFLFGPFGASNVFTLRLDIYTANDDGKPDAIIATKTLDASTITSDGWHFFDVDETGVTPTNRLLSFVLSQEGGDENDHVLWGHIFSEDTVETTSAWFSNDAIIWQKQEGLLRALRVIGDFDAFDLDEFQALTPPAELTTVGQNIGESTVDGGGDGSSGGGSGEVFDGTELIEGDNYNPAKVVINYPDFISSFVIDSSGSMGWNDKCNKRTEIVEAFLDKFGDNYPANTRFDLIKFGSLIANTESGVGEVGTAATINIDLNTPSRTTYVFTTDSATASDGSIYDHNGAEYVVINSISAETTLVTSSDTDPLGDGVLTLSSGAGDATISFSSVQKITIEDNIVAYGFINLEKGRTYNIGEFAIDNGLFDSVDVTNWQSFDPSGDSVAFSLGNNGPFDTPSVDITVTEDLVIRKPISKFDITTTALTANVLEDDTAIPVADPLIVEVGEAVDIVDGDFASINHIVTASNTTSSTITIDPASKLDILSFSNAGGIAQTSNFNEAVSIVGTTGQLLIRDVQSGSSSLITLFLQTIDGFFIEYDFQPFNDWFVNSLFFLENTAFFPVEILDQDGEPFPDGSRVVFYVDGIPNDATVTLPTKAAKRDAAIGDTKIYVNTDNLARELTIDLFDSDGNLQRTTIEEIGEDSLGTFIVIAAPLTFAFLIANGARLVVVDPLEDTGGLSEALRLAVPLSLIDITPITTGKSLDSSLLEPHDPDPISPSTSLSDLNLDKDRIQVETIDVPTIDGKASIRVLPITEDVLFTIEEKRLRTEGLLRLSPPGTFSSQLEQSEGDSESLITTTTTTLDFVTQGEDFTISNPNFLRGGNTIGTMVSFASTGFDDKIFPGVNIPGVLADDVNEGSGLFVRAYEITPSLTLQDADGNVVARQFFESFDADFTPPISISSEYVGPTVTTTCDLGFDSCEPNDADCCPCRHLGFSEEEFQGVYAGSSDSFTMEYVVADKGVLVKDGTLKIRIYSNRVADLDGLICSLGQSSTRLDLNVISEDEPSRIDSWRDIVDNNPISEFGEVLNPGSVLVTGSDETLTGSEETDPSNIFDSSASFGGLDLSEEFKSLDSNLKRVLFAADFGGSVTPSFSEAFKAARALRRSINPFFISEGFSTQIGGFARTLNQVFNFDNPLEWIKATEVGSFQEIDLEVVNGRATLEIDATDIPAALFIQASVEFGENVNFEVIRSDMVLMGNPIHIGANDPVKIEALGGDSLYEITTTVDFEDVSIEDNVTVNFGPSRTSAIPSVSKTSEGIASGVFLGPHDIPNSPPGCDGEGCDRFFEVEALVIEVSHLGFSKTVIRPIVWSGSPTNRGEEGEAEEGEFIKLGFETISDGFLWTDGDITSQEITLISELDKDLNLGPNMVGFFDSSFEQITTAGGDGRPIKIQYDTGISGQDFGALYTKLEGIVIVPDSERWQVGSVGVPETGFSNAKIIRGLNSNIGFQQPRSPATGCPKDSIPWSLFVTATAGYRLNESDNKSPVQATGVVAAPVQLVDPSGLIITCFPKPKMALREPLGISVAIESLNGSFLRNGVEAETIIATVTWKGKPIDGTHTFHEGLVEETTISFALPDVIFEAGTCAVINKVDPEDPGSAAPSTFFDNRNDISGCAIVEEHEDVTLRNYVAEVSLSRTDIQTDEDGNAHTHEIGLDEDGKSLTIRTIVLSGTVVAHVHTMSDLTKDTVTDSAGSPAHTHELRSVAITTLNAMTNLNVNITINATVKYDPTNAGLAPASNVTVQVFKGELPSGVIQPVAVASRSFYDDDNPEGNRLMFASLFLNSQVSDRSFIFSLTSEQGFTVYTAERVIDTSRGFNFTVEASFSAFVVEEPPGSGITTTIPATDVPDGTRVIFEIEAFKALPSPEGSDITKDDLEGIHIVRSDEVKRYMDIRVRATIHVEDIIDSEERLIRVDSLLKWFPSVKGLVVEPTDDDLEISSALTKVETIGASQIHDAIKLASNRLIDFQTDFPSFQDAKKIIFLLTDGDENSSECSLDQALNAVNTINGTQEVPVIPIQMGVSFSSDTVFLRKYSIESGATAGGLIEVLKDPSTEDIANVVDDIVTSNLEEVNSGTYTNTIDLGASNIAATMSFNSFTVPTGSQMLIRVRFSADNVGFTPFTEFFDITQAIDFPLSFEGKGRFFQYEVLLKGNEAFETPTLLSGANMTYFKSKSFTIFFQPIGLDITTDEFLASIHITHEATVPTTSMINYGLCQCESVNLEDYSSLTQPAITPDRHSIVLTRFNELFLTNDFVTYNAINGRWPQGSIVEVLKFNSNFPNGIKIDSSEYAENSTDGSITFNASQNIEDSFTLNVFFDPIFRVICSVTNFGPQEVVLDSVGIMYNVTKRIPRDIEGNIINTPINQRIDE